MSERSLLDSLDALTEQLKTSTKDITASIELLKQELHSIAVGSLSGLESILTKLDVDVKDLSTTLKKVLEVEVITKKAATKK